jgi:uncharacterized protein with GYD domain
MARYVILGTFAEKTVADVPANIGEGAPRVRGVIEKHGGALLDAYLTMGQYDVLLITEFPDNEACGRAVLEYSQLGLLRTVTMPAFPESAWAELAR